MVGSRSNHLDIRSRIFDLGELRLLGGFLMALIVIGALNKPLGLPLNLRVLPVLAGFLFLICHGRLSRTYLPIYLLVLLGYISAIVNNPGPETYFRLFQIFCLTGVSYFVSLQNPNRLPHYIAVFLPGLAIAIVLLEYFVVGPEGSRVLFGVSIPRFAGLTGHHNYNAVLCSFIAILMTVHKKYLLAVLFLSISLAAASRGFLVAGLIAAMFYSVRRFWFFRYLFLASLIAICSLPLIVLLVDRWLSEDMRVLLTLLSSKRYVHWLTYIQMGLEHPFLGVGYFNGKDVYEIYHVEVVPGFLRQQDAHNLFVSLWGEFGILGWALISVFFLQVGNRLIRMAPDFAPIFMFLVVAYSFYNAMTEWPLWVGIGYLIAIAAAGQERDYRTDVQGKFGLLWSGRVRRGSKSDDTP